MSFFYCELCGGKKLTRRRGTTLIATPHDANHCIAALAGRLKKLEDAAQKDKVTPNAGQ